jgi:hypothetical protein
MPTDQLEFIQNGQFLLLEKLTAESPANWGVMNAQQMVEHISDFFNVSTEKIKTKLFTPEEHLPKFMEFLYSDKQFRENTKAPAELLVEEAQPERYPDLATVKQQLQQTVNNFLNYFKNDPGKKTLHPVFDWLNFEEWIRLHYKHVTHHLRQFGLMGKS